MARAALFIIFLVLQLLHLGRCRSVKDSNVLISDGLDDKLISQSSSLLQVVDDLKADTVTCEPIYGFLPCATSFWGLAFMVIVYEILLYLANSFITSGSELFFQMYGTGLFGASVFHLLGTVPQVGIVLVTGVTGTAETAEAMATMNMGMVAGSAIMLLTLVWGSVVAFGSYDISESPTSSNRGHKNRFSITGYGVTTDAETRSTARIMMVSLIPFLILQVAKVLSSTSGIRIVILVSLLVSFAFLVAYCIYQKTLLPSFLTASGDPDVSNIQGVFTRIDQNHNTYISVYELRALILGIQIGEVGLDSDYVDKAMEDFDISGGSQISEQEFVDGISKWVNATPSANGQGQGHRRFLSSKTEEALGGKQKQVSKKKKSKLTDKTWTNQLKAACLLILGIGIMILLATPLMETIQDFSTAASIPSFFTSYVLIPLAINYGQALQLITSAQDKTENAVSLSLSEIYNGVFMNNVMGLTIFLALVYIPAGLLKTVLISDGLDENLFSQSSSFIQVVDDLKADTVTCEPIYGFLPCATSFWGVPFLVIVYEILLYLANSFITSGSELFFKMYGSKFFGASVFHLLGTVPQVGIVLVTGITGTAETAEAMATMNMSMVAGSGIMLLTLVWGSVVVFGSSDVSESPSSLNQGLTKFFSTCYCVTTDADTRSTARIMMVSVIPFLILQVAKVLSSTSGIRIVILVSLLVSIAFLVTYCIYQVFRPWIQDRRLDILLPGFLNANGDPNVSYILEVFSRIDQNHNNYISEYELRALILGIQIGDVGLEIDYLEKAMKNFDKSGDSRISEKEFVDGISKWVNATPSANGQGQAQGQRRFLSSKSKEALEEQQKQVPKKMKNKHIDKTWRTQLKAACLLIIGIGIMILLATPLMETIQDFSTAASIPSFLSSYVLIPFAINIGQALQLVTSAQHKTENAISLTLSEIYNGVFMNNIMGLTIFLALVYIQSIMGCRCSILSCSDHLLSNGCLYQLQHKVSILDMYFSLHYVPHITAHDLCSYHLLWMDLKVRKELQCSNI
ncbi:hypothetical protein ACLB2K_028138 [Fragaria x ananassa]